MFTKDKIIAFVIVCSLVLTISLNATIVAEDGCNGTNKFFGEMTWGLAIGVIVLWVLSILAIAWKTGVGFGFNKLQNAGEYMLLTFFGSLILPAIVLSAADDNHSGQIRSDMNNIAVIGLITSILIVLSTILDVMFNKKLYDLVTKSLGLKKRNW